MTRIKHEDCQIVATSEMPGSQTLVTLRDAQGVTQTIPCICRRFLRSLKTKGPERFLTSLQAWRIHVWIEDGIIVDMEPLRRGESYIGARRAQQGHVPADDRPSEAEKRSTGRRKRPSRIEALLSGEGPWIHPGEADILRSFLAQLNDGKRLSERQRAWLRELRARIRSRKRPRFFRG